VNTCIKYHQHGKVPANRGTDSISLITQRSVPSSAGGGGEKEKRVLKKSTNQEKRGTERNCSPRTVQRIAEPLIVSQKRGWSEGR